MIPTSRLTNSTKVSRFRKMKEIFSDNTINDAYGTTGLDRFGQVVDHAWKKSTTDVVRIQHGYDYNGNRTYRKDIVGASRSEFYTYDGVNQVKSLDRGTLNSSNNGVTTMNFAEQFTFDKTGNFANYWWASINGSTVLDYNESRSHNPANEIALINGSATKVASDKNGNMTKMPKPSGGGFYDCIYDAWNRLVQVKDGATIVGTYLYNGMNHRVKKTVGATVTTSFFDEQWRELESTSSEASMIYVWGLRYIDDILYRDKGSERIYSLADPNWNVVALANTSGVILERITYNAFGKVSWHDASFGSKMVSGYGWNRTFTGQVLDNETGLMLYRNRYYHVTLGRFVSRDPIGYRGNDMSLYRYVMNRSINFIDFQGLTLGCGRQYAWKYCPPQTSTSWCTMDFFMRYASPFGNKDTTLSAIGLFDKYLRDNQNEINDLKKRIIEKAKNDAPEDCESGPKSIKGEVSKNAFWKFAGSAPTSDWERWTRIETVFANYYLSATYECTAEVSCEPCCPGEEPIPLFLSISCDVNFFFKDIFQNPTDKGGHFAKNDWWLCSPYEITERWSDTASAQIKLGECK